LGAPEVKASVKTAIHENFKGTIILSGGYNAVKAEQDLKDKKGDLVAFGRYFISNPDLVKKLKLGLHLQDADTSTFYTPGGKGYTDYQSN